MLTRFQHAWNYKIVSTTNIKYMYHVLLSDLKLAIFIVTLSKVQSIVLLLVLILPSSSSSSSSLLEVGISSVT